MLRKVRVALVVGAAILACSSEDALQNSSGTCATGQSVCSSVCVSLASDPSNCGQCGNVCTTGLVCSQSACSASCASGLSACNSACVDVSTDASNCGKCGNSCGTNACVSGICSAVSTGGGTGTGGTSSGTGTTWTNYNGYLPVPNSGNTANANPATWYATWKSNFYVECDSTSARIASGIGSSETFSEGIGYGMLLAVGNDDQAAFDKLWTYYQGRYDSNGLMNWKINACSTEAWGTYAATDAEEDVAMALIQADAKWGGYKTAAVELIGKIKTYETSSTTSPAYLRPGDAANNGGKGEGVVNPSYFAIGYWHVFAQYTGDTSWNTLADAAYAMLASFQALTISGYTGALVPDWGYSSGTNPNNSGYYYDACRTPWRVMVDYAWFGTPAAQTFLQNISTFVDAKGGISAVPFDKNSAFLGAFALSGMAVSQAKADEYLNAWLSTTMDDTPYFQSSLRGLYLLLANHNFPPGL